MEKRDIIQKNFRIFIFLSVFILLLEVAGGIFTNSLALLSDSGHVLIDSLALIMAYFAIQLARKKSTEKFTFGYYRAEILATITNGLVLIFVTLYIFYESYIRFSSHQLIKGPEMLIISIIGLFGNLYVVIKMQSYEKENLNVRAAYLHVLTDLLSSVGVVIAGILIVITGNYIFDIVISVIIGLLILVSSMRLLTKSIHILMEATPESIDLEKLIKDMEKMEGVMDVHDLHVWSITSDVYALSSHVLIDAKNVESMNKIVSRINKTLKSKYNITHTVIQSECKSCVDGKNKHNH